MGSRPPVARGHRRHPRRSTEGAHPLDSPRPPPCRPLAPPARPGQRHHRHDARPRHRCEHRGVLPAQRDRSRERAAGCARGSALLGQYRQVCRVGPRSRALFRPPVRAARTVRTGRRRRRRDEPGDRPRLHAPGRRARDVARQPAARLAELLPAAGTVARARADAAGGGTAGTGSRREPRLLAAALRWRRGRRRTHHDAQRRRVHNRRRRSARLRRCVARDTGGYLGAAHRATDGALLTELQRRRRELLAAVAAAGADPVAPRARPRTGGAGRGGGWRVRRQHPDAGRPRSRRRTGAVRRRLLARPAAVLGAARGTPDHGGPGPAHRLRQRRQPPAVARGDATARARGADRDGRRARSAAPPAADRERAARRRGRGRRRGVRAMGRQRAPAHRHGDDGRTAAVCRTDRPAGAGVCGGGRIRVGPDLRGLAGVAGDARRSRQRAEGERAGNDGRRTPPRPRAGRAPGRAVARARHRHRTLRAQLSEPRRRRSRHLARPPRHGCARSAALGPAGGGAAAATRPGGGRRARHPRRRIGGAGDVPAADELRQGGWLRGRRLPAEAG